MSRSIFRSTSIGVFAIGALIGGVAFMTGASGIVGSPTAAAVPSQEEPEPYVICTRAPTMRAKTPLTTQLLLRGPLGQSRWSQAIRCPNPTTTRTT